MCAVTVWFNLFALIFRQSFLASVELMSEQWPIGMSFHLFALDKKVKNVVLFLAKMIFARFSKF